MKKAYEITNKILRSDLKDKLTAISYIHSPYNGEEYDFDDDMARFILLECVQKNLVLKLEVILNMYVLEKASLDVLALVFAIPDYDSVIWPDNFANIYMTATDPVRKSMLLNLTIGFKTETMTQFCFELASFGVTSLPRATSYQILKRYKEIIKGPRGQDIIDLETLFSCLETTPKVPNEIVTSIEMVTENESVWDPAVEESLDAYTCFREDIIFSLNHQRLRSVTIHYEDGTTHKSNFKAKE